MIRQKMHTTKWQQINHRNVQSLMAAEFLHDLYNRHNPFINSIRFRNTVVEFREGEARSFAPAAEWDMLRTWFGVRFRRTEDPIFAELEALLSKEHTHTLALERRLDETDLDEISNLDLALFVVDLHYIPLGDIYEVNLVQIEYALHHAVMEELEEILGTASAAEAVLARTLGDSASTVAGQEAAEFIALVLRSLARGVASLASGPSLAAGRGAVPAEAEVLAAVTEFAHRWGHVHNAYGNGGHATTDYILRYNEHAAQGQTRLRGVLQELKRKRSVTGAACAQVSVLEDSVTLRRNVELLARLGMFRDQNKALLGRIVGKRDCLLRGISVRTGVPLKQLQFYLVHEVCQLLAEGRRIRADRISRRQDGVRFVRREFVEASIRPSVEADAATDADLTQTDITLGTCACPGQHEGRVVIVRSSVDIPRMTRGDVMVAPGTDLNVMSAMQLAGAIVTEEGGILSHAAVVAREFGVPCIIGAEGACTKLATGDRVRVDATRGRVRRIL